MSRGKDTGPPAAGQSHSQPTERVQSMVLTSHNCIHYWIHGRTKCFLVEGNFCLASVAAVHVDVVKFVRGGSAEDNEKDLWKKLVALI